MFYLSSLPEETSKPITKTEVKECTACFLPVLSWSQVLHFKLTRTQYGFLKLDNLKSGEYRLLSIKEVKKLYKYQSGKDKKTR